MDDLSVCHFICCAGLKRRNLEAHIPSYIRDDSRRKTPISATHLFQECSKGFLAHKVEKWVSVAAQKSLMSLRSGDQGGEKEDIQGYD